ncbi:MAG: DMT family transporter [Candidatus Thermoplasmatota archaeon]|jgi:drug/metabolite transporter (DMT)-like permease|nr:DMT family transporter [Candidatus Thermoplasmatota archaeon]MEC8217439.1 DMT family transporter [Candidatus Thermoplasmatota archaeon]MEC8671630.1 DMT family transporter [Candidatus Thermoplasmatota archaeon]MEE3081949.1 DMT family transporter [Candidatus Thermoplasmatota archaeon]|tara:strand:+ start:3371 stop:4258 length:888 start_codon:yes stop_codon:yes gene_type:complete
MFFVAFFWGLAWPVGRILATDLLNYPFSVMFLRYIFAVPVLFGWLWFKEGNVIPLKRDYSYLLLLAFTSVFLYQVGYMYGMQKTAASDASLIIGFNPVSVSILSVFILSHNLTRNGVLGILLSFIGVLLIFLASPNLDIDFYDRIVGNAYIMLGAFAYAIYVVSMRRYVLLTQHKPLSSLATISWASLVGCILFVPFVILEAPWERIWNNQEWLLIAYLGVLSTALCYVFFAMGIETIGANKAASFINVVPIFGILSSWIWIGENLGFVQIISFILIYYGVKLVNQQPAEELRKE